MQNSEKPIAGIDYPATFQEFDEWFSCENACLEFIGKLRWPTGFICPGCGFQPKNPSLMGRGLYLCVKCKKQTSVTSGTLFHQTHKPLRTWFLAMWFVTSQKYGASALGLQRVLGLGSYNTAWNWLHKLRRAMVRPGRDRLTGTVEVDEAYVGGVGTGTRGRGAERKSIVAIAVEVRGRGMGRIRMSVIPNVSSNSLHGFILNSVEKGSEIRSDGWSAATMDSEKKAMATLHSISVQAAILPMLPCLAYTASHPSWIDGGLGFIREQSAPHILTTISMSSLSGSTAAHPKLVGCFSTAFLN